MKRGTKAGNEEEVRGRGRKIHRLGEGLKMQRDREAKEGKTWRVCEKVIREKETAQRESENKRQTKGLRKTNRGREQGGIEG